MKLHNLVFTLFATAILAACGEQQASSQPTQATQSQSAPAVQETQQQAATEKKPLVERMKEAYDEGAIKGFRTSFQQSGVESCVNDVVKSGIPRAEATSVCECSFKKVVDSLSDDDILVIVKNNSVTAEIEAKIEKAMDNVEECRK